MPEERYKANLGAFSAVELDKIAEKSVCIVGCGGLGGYVCNALARFKIGSLTVVDGDVFAESNLNRQLFAAEDTLEKSKAAVCAEALLRVNSALKITAVSAMLSDENAQEILSGHDLVMDCLDNPESRLVLEKNCNRLDIPFIHGAVDGFAGQVAVVLPGDDLMKKLYSTDDAYAPSAGSPVFTVQAVSALQCSEALKLLAGRGHLHGELLHINLEDNAFQIIKV